MTASLQSLVGLLVIPLIAIALCEARERLRPVAVIRIIAVGLALQIALASVLVTVPAMRHAFMAAGQAVAVLQAATNEGVRLVFGYLAGGPAPFDAINPNNGFLLGFQALPLILVVSVLSKILFHWGILQRVVGFFAFALRRLLGVSGPLGTAAAANIFVGMVEAPLLIRPYIRTMSRSDLFATMVTGMATVAGTVMALYASILASQIDGAAGHIMVASMISAPAALMLAWLMVPPDPHVDRHDQPNGTDMDIGRSSSSTMDAIAEGTQDGLKLLAYVAAMLVVMVALVSLANTLLAAVTSPFGTAMTFQEILGWICAPLSWLAGIPWAEAKQAGSLIGTKIVLNELLAYLELANLPSDALSPRSRLIMTYVLCGFANLGSLGIMVGGLVAIAPERRHDIVSLGLKSIIAGTLATLLTGAVIGIVVWQ